MLPYLTELTKQFTKYALVDVAKMDSTHAIRMYELIMQWESVGRREISIDELREWFQLQDKYPSIKDFKLRVLHPAIAEINEHSQIMDGWTQKKPCRKVTH
ncbi:RepB family plasmid replication initiator protein, partial [Pseudomonas helleri]|nr:RepB family plasmid replication initiator protein [Pseudomonas helleri]